MKLLYLSVIALLVVPSSGAIIFSDNMTNFPTGWTLYGTVGQYWTRSSARYYSSSYSAKCTPSSNYGNNVDVCMERAINLSGYSYATVTFYIWQYTENYYDFVYLQYYTSSWITAWSRSGSYQSWQKISVNIPVNATKIRFKFKSDGSVVYEGVYIDDVKLEARKEWTIMVFMNADNNLETYGIQDFNEMESGGGSNSNRNVVVQIDRIPGFDNSNGDWTGCRRYYVTSDNNSTTINSTLIQDLGEVDMGSPATLVQFVQWGIQNYPANKYFLILWDHGDGWYLTSQPIESNLFRGFSSDYSSGNAIDVANGELASALSQIKNTLGKRVDLIGWDCCLMGMWEVMDICKDYANVMVGSEEIESADGWYYTYFLNDLNSNPTMSAIDLGKSVVNGTTQRTLAVIDLSKVPILTVEIDTFARQLIQGKTQGYSNIIDSVRNVSKQFYISAHIDLYDFAQQLYNSSVPTFLKNAAAGVENAIINAVALYKNSSSYSMCRGVAIYYPSSTSSYNSAYTNLPVASITQWDEYLRGNIDYSVSQTTYSWITTSTPTGITGDDQSKNFTLPFSFSFYGKSYNSVNICSNGFLSFTSTSTGYNPATIPNTADPNALVAPFWRDLNPAGGGSITYYSGSDKFIVSWNAVKNFSNSNTQTFEVILYPNGEIVFQYKSVTNDVTTSIGIENQLGTSGKSINPPANSTAWKFSPSFIYMPAPPLDEMTRTSNGEGSERNLIVYPNPAKGRIHFTYRIIKKSWATIKIYNEIGQVVKTILNKECEPGIYTSEWTDEGLPSGAYFYRFHTDSDETCGKFLFLK